MKCPNCGNEIANDSVFCEYCGKPVKEENANYSSQKMMSFGKAISTCFNKYATASGRATRAEYWWFFLFVHILNYCVGWVFNPISYALQIPYLGSILLVLCMLGLLIPGICVAVRRCHDTNHSGWWLLCPIYNIVLMLLPSDEGANDYGMLGE